jgi:hypothetical protein
MDAASADEDESSDEFERDRRNDRIKVFIAEAESFRTDVAENLGMGIDEIELRHECIY